MSHLTFGIRNQNIDSENPLPGKMPHVSTPRLALSEIKNRSATPSAVKKVQQNLFNGVAQTVSKKIIYEDTEYIKPEPAKKENKTNFFEAASEVEHAGLDPDHTISDRNSTSVRKNAELSEFMSYLPSEEKIEKFNIGLRQESTMLTPVKFVKLEEKSRLEEEDDFDYSTPIESFGRKPEPFVDMRDFYVPDIVLTETRPKMLENNDFDFWSDPQLFLDVCTVEQIDAFVEMIEN